MMGSLWWPHSPGLEEPSLILIGLAKLTRIVRPKSSDSFWKDGKFSCLNSVRVRVRQVFHVLQIPEACSNLFSLNPWAPNSKLCTHHKAALGVQGDVSLEPSHTSFLSTPAKNCATNSNSGFRVMRVNAVSKYPSSPSKVKISFEMVRNDFW